MKLSLIAILFVISAYAIIAEVKVPDEEYASPDIAIAEYIITDTDYNADNTGKNDSTEIVQQAINDAWKNGGGVVFFPNGIYRFDGSLRLKQGVSLRGKWKNPKDIKGRTAGTIFAVYGNKGIEKSEPFILMEKVSCVTNLNFWYPEQNAMNIIPYPWTIDVTDNSSCGYAIRNVNFVNSYKAISNGADTKTCHNVGFYSNIYGCPLKEGLWVEWVLDITRVNKVFFSPHYWKNSGLPGSPKTEIAEESVREFMYENATAITSKRFDWFPLYIAELDGYGTGIKITDGENGGANGEMYGVKIYNGKIGILAEASQPCGWTITNCDISTLDKDDAYSVLFKSRIRMAPFQFNSCDIGRVKIESGSECSASFENCGFDGDLVALSGDVSIINSKFKNNKKAFFANFKNDTMIDENVPYASRSNNIRIVKAPQTKRLDYDPHPFAPFRRPKSNKVFAIKDFGAKGDGITDDTATFKKALKSAGIKGGTVYVSAGKYPITEPLVIPSGVELRGIFEGPSHIMVPGSIIFVETGHGEENGTPFISLSENSGVRGMNFWYPKQSIDNPAPYPWTIRALGRDCYVRDASLGQTWQAMDFASADDTSGHAISNVGATALCRGLFADNAPEGGTVEGVHLVIHHWDRNDSGLPITGTPLTSIMPDGNGILKKQTENFDFGNCKNERIFSTFGYSSRSGLTLRKNFEGTIHQHGTDGTSTGVRIYDNAKALFVNTLIAPVSPIILYSSLGINVKFLDPEYEPDPKIPAYAIYIDESFAGDVRFANTSTWGFGQSLQAGGIGNISINQIISMLAESIIQNPNTHITSAYGFFGHEFNWQNDIKPNEASLFGPTMNTLASGRNKIVSFNATAKASSEVSAGQGAKCATDASAASLFATQNVSAPAWVEIDLPEPRQVRSVSIIHTGIGDNAILNTSDFKLFGRKDKSQDWQEIADVKDNTDFVTTHEANGEYSSIRIEISKPNRTEHDYHTRMKEITIFGK